jgi:hypothetical protein
MNKIEIERSERATFLRKRIFKAKCPVCVSDLNARHTVAHVCSCNFSGPSLLNGFLRQVKNREWRDVVQPFSRLTSMDLMACEVLRCPSAMAIVVWVEVDLVFGGDQYLAYFERIDEYDLEQIEQVVPLNWTRF